MKAYKRFSEEPIDKPEGDDSLLLDLEDGVFSINFGIPIVVVGTKVCGDMSCQASGQAVRPPIRGLAPLPLLFLLLPPLPLPRAWYSPLHSPTAAIGGQAYQRHGEP